MLTPSLFTEFCWAYLLQNFYLPQSFEYLQIQKEIYQETQLLSNS